MEYIKADGEDGFGSALYFKSFRRTLHLSDHQRWDQRRSIGTGRGFLFTPPFYPLSQSPKYPILDASTTTE
eukprot:scaffold22653_cov119-Cylindrotheca_fusiformis.AAC.17